MTQTKHWCPDTFVAAVTIAAARICPISDLIFQPSSLKPLWERCKFVLEHYKPQVEAANTALYVMEILDQRIESLKEHGKS